MAAGHFVTNRHAMRVFGLHVPLISHREAVRDVVASFAVTLGFALGGWLFGTPLDRESAIALFVGFLYIQLADGFLARTDARMKRYALAAAGAGMLVASAALFEHLI
ncbi:MAG: hypothetical protein AB7G13_24580 [Lautropia sp.]